VNTLNKGDDDDDDDDDSNNKEVTPVIIGATETISKSFVKCLSNIPGKHDIKECRQQPYWALRAHASGSNDVEVQNIQQGK
jgi:hypothetical protein